MVLSIGILLVRWLERWMKVVLKVYGQVGREGNSSSLGCCPLLRKGNNQVALRLGNEHLDVLLLLQSSPGPRMTQARPLSSRLSWATRLA
jgi:hypothetical protein